MCSVTLEQHRGELEKAELDAKVPQELLSLRDYQDRLLAHERAEAALEKAEADLQAFQKATEEDVAIRRITQEKARDEIRVAEEAIRALTLHAPRDGVLVISSLPWEGRKLQESDTVWAGLTVARIPDLSVMEVVVSLSDVDDGKVRVGTPAACTLDAYPELEFRGTVTEIAPLAQETSPRSLRRAFRVRIALKHSEPPLIPRTCDFKIARMAPEGSEVKKGMPVLAFDASNLQRELQEKKAEHESAEKEIEKKRTDIVVNQRNEELRLAEAEAKLEKAALKLERPDELVAAQELRKLQIDHELAEKEVAFLKEKLAALKRAAEAELTLLRDQRDRAAGRVRELEASIARMSIVAPRDGTVIYLVSRRGES